MEEKIGIKIENNKIKTTNTAKNLLIFIALNTPPPFLNIHTEILAPIYKKFKTHVHKFLAKTLLLISKNYLYISPLFPVLTISIISLSLFVM